MPGPTSDFLALVASTTSSGFADGLGRRALAFDREEGTMLERLTLRPELAAFETMLRERLERVAALEDERMARLRSIEHDADGALVVVSEFVPGSRLSDLLDHAADQGAAPGIDAAFGFLLDVLPALCGLHAAAGFAHGTIAPSRTVLTPAGQVVLQDGIYGGALAHLRYSRRKLWVDFGIASPAGVSRLDVESDISQVVLASVMLVLGRPLYEDEFPAALPRVVSDVADVAQIRASADFASGFVSFLQRALPLPDRIPYSSADDALIALRDLAGELGGLQQCRRALVDFIEQMEPSGAQQAAVDAETDVESSVETRYLAPDAQSPYDDVLADIANFGLYDAPELIEVEAVRDEEDDDEEEEEEPGDEIDLEALVEEPQHDREPAASTVESQADATGVQDRQIEEVVAASATSLPTAPVEDADAPSSVRSKRAKRTRSARARKDKLRSAAVATPLVTQKGEPVSVREPVTPEIVEPVEKPRVQPIIAIKERHDAPVAEARNERQTLAPEPGVVPKDDPRPEPSKQASSNWLVAPGRAAAFDPPVTDEPYAAPAPPPAPFSTVAAQPAVAAPPMPFTSNATFVPAPPPVAPAPIPAPPPPARPTIPTYSAPQPWSPAAAPTPMAPPTPPIPHPVISLKLKDAPRPRAHRPAPVEDIYAASPPPEIVEEPSKFPWKLAAGALVAMAVLIVGGRSYLTSSPRSGAVDAETVVASTAAAAAAPVVAATRPDTPTRPPATSSPVEAAAIGATTGRLEIETQPAGAKVSIDGKPAGESPLTIEALAAGRHIVTLTNDSGSVKRVIRIEPGRSMKLDVPIFSGWVGIFAPFVVEVSEAGRLIGTTEESRLMLSPGRHELTLTNRELGYQAVEGVEIEPGEVRSVRLDPRGTVNLNATPWAEVWVDGKKVGDTPLAGLQLPLGTQEVMFRHPQFGERKVTVTVRGNAPAALSVTMTK